MKNYYAILEIAPGSEPDEIRRAYRRISAQTMDDPAAFAEAAEAFHTLDDPSRRARYDRSANDLAQEPPMESTVLMGAATHGARHCPLNAGGQCPVLRDSVAPGESFCPECGFALAEMPADGFGPVAAAQAEAMPYLEEQAGKQHRLKPGGNAVGRETGDVLITDKTVSRQHAQIEVSPEGAISLLDLGSTNGTQLNGERLTPHAPRAARSGDAVRFGSVRLTLHVPGAAPELEAEQEENAAERTMVFGENAPPAAGPAEAVAARLIGDQGREIDLEIGTTTFGRTPENSVILSGDPYVSGRHAQIIVAADGAAQVVDVGSTNGTTLNGIRLTPQTPAPLAPDDKIKFGGSGFRYKQVAVFSKPVVSQDEAPPAPAGEEGDGEEG